MTVSWNHGPTETDDGVFSWAEATPAGVVSARVIKPGGTYLDTQPWTAGAPQQVKVTDKTAWLSVGTYTVELQDNGDFTLASGTFVVAAPATLTGGFTAPRTWDWTEVVGAAADARVLEPGGVVLVPGTANIGAQEYEAEVTYTPDPGDYVLQLRNANFVIINEDPSVTVP